MNSECQTVTSELLFDQSKVTRWLLETDIGWVRCYRTCSKTVAVTSNRRVSYMCSVVKLSRVFSFLSKIPALVLHLDLYPFFSIYLYLPTSRSAEKLSA